jgi:PilZ domain-containing protein
MKHPEERATGISERRRVERQDAQGKLRVILDTPEFGGEAENVSPAGVFFFSDTTLRVTVEIFEHGELRSYPGQLVRVQRMSESQTGYAIEFDRP